ncbi:MAG TPA: RHS repeat-associated core domain-containing protein [Candidatus Acidoferrales bacterium]|nr:RHS repeat-associated core domain-containing protein [Candidatus Acidoferrales bacterium]
METNAAGTVIAQCTYAPFGQVVTCPTDDGANHYRFTGQERDAETGLDNFLAREFTSQFGRFSQPDPAGLAAVDLSDPQSLNRYSYVRNTPTGLVDPSGMYYVLECGGGRVAGGTDPGQYNCTFKWVEDEYYVNTSPTLNVPSPIGGGCFMYYGFSSTPICSGTQNTGGGPGLQEEIKPYMPAKFTAPPLFQRIVACTEKNLGLTVGAASAAALGAPVPKSALGVGQGFAWASEYTSVSGAVGFSLFGAAEPKIGLSILGTTRVFGIVGRASPYVAAALGASAVARIASCVKDAGKIGFGGGHFGGAGASGVW